MKCEVITIGDELLIGQVVNTNLAYIAGKLTRVGITVQKATTVGDNLPDILLAFERAMAATDVVLVTGGLGPTHDDVTRTAVCQFFESELTVNEEIRKHILRLFARRNITWNPSAEQQILFPAKAEMIPNPVGTAAGMLFHRDGKMLIVLPGVPYEMKEMIDQSVVPLLSGRVSGRVIHQRTLKTTGIAESVLAERLGDLDELLQGTQLAFLPSPSGVRLRISVIERDPTVAERRVKETEDRILQKAAKYVYGVDDDELEEVLGRILRDRHLTIAVAESCTGGLIGDRLTDVPGSSEYFLECIVAYSYEAKTRLLGVPDALLKAHGAVSKEVAEAMAAGVRGRAGTDIGLSVTGIAGPAGATPEKPVGLVWIGCADSSGTVALKFMFGDNRRRTKERAAQAALELVRRRLLRIT